jgi:pyrimidine operon attenuation protein / uracil phosphoribosyltransferase
MKFRLTGETGEIFAYKMLNPATEMKMNKKSHKILDASEIDRILTRITHEILEKHKGTENLALIGIQTRGVYLAKRIQKKIQEVEGVEIMTGDMDITLYRDDWTRISHNPLVQLTEIPFSVDEKQIVLVDDVLFTGRTVRSAMDALIDFGRPARIELAVLVDRGHRELPIQADYVGKFVETRQSEMVNVLLADHDDSEQVVIEGE